jgi:hypothetical protein
MIVVIIVFVSGFWYGSQLVCTQDPALTVAWSSMCKKQWIHRDGSSQPLARTLNAQDLIITQGVSPEEIHAAPEPKVDIIVLRQIMSDESIVHKAIASATIGRKIFFQTKEDGNPSLDENTPTLLADRVISKVVMCIPYIGHLAL